MPVRRRKKVWIACTVLAVVWVLYAFALLYRPIPYRFLEGTREAKREVVDGPKGDATLLSFKVRGTMDALVAKAQEELNPEDGWSLRRVGTSEVHIENGDRAVIIDALGGIWATENGRIPLERGTVHVTVVEMATPLDRVREWLHHR